MDNFVDTSDIQLCGQCLYSDQFSQLTMQKRETKAV